MTLTETMRCPQDATKEAAIGVKNQFHILKVSKKHEPTSTFASGCNWGCLDWVPDRTTPSSWYYAMFS